MSFSFTKIDGFIVCFYHSTSRFSDSKMIEDWIKRHYPIKWNNDTRNAMTNAQNFHHVLRHIDFLKQSKTT